MFKHATPSCAQPAVLPTDTNASSAVRISTAAYKNRSTTLFVPVFAAKTVSNLHSPIEISYISPHPPQTLAAHFKRPYRNCPDHTNLGIAHFCFGAVPIGIYRLRVLILFVKSSAGVNERIGLKSPVRTEGWSANERT